MRDGWEYQSARRPEQRRLQQPAYPTPCDAGAAVPLEGPYPNPLDGSDGGSDFDGDWIPASRSTTAWAQHPGHA